MPAWKELLRRAVWLGRRSRFEEELEQEVAFHLESRIQELEDEGLDHAAARQQARREFGPAARVREETRSAWQFRWAEDLFADLRYAARALRRNPAFALTAVACLALGIGANTTIFSIAVEVLFSQPSVRDADSVVNVEFGGNSHAPLPVYRMAQDSGVFSGLAGFNENGETNWRHGEATDRLFAVRVTGNFFAVMGTPVAMGRGIQPGESDVTVLGNGFWRSRLGADPAVLGRVLILDGHAVTVVGVLPRDHRTVLGFGFTPDLYLPVAGEQAVVALYGRLPEGTTRQSLSARLQPLAREMNRIYPNRGWAQETEIAAISGWTRVVTHRETRTIAAFFGMLLVVVGLVLAIACANVASLLLARASSRSQEMAIRLSIGAGRGRILRQLLAESLLLASIGTAAGLVLNVVLTALLSQIRLPVPVPIQFRIQPDWRLLGYAVALALGTSLAAGLIPAIHTTRAGIHAAIKRSERQVARGRWTLGNLLVAGQLAVSIVLLCAAFLFLRNLLSASAMNPGFDTEHTVWAYMRLVPENYPQAKVYPFVGAAVERLRAIPGVEAASIVRVVPLNDARNIQTPVTTDVDPQPVTIRWRENEVSAGYFQTMRIPILAGREFLPSDRAGSAAVIIVNENMARRLFGRADPVGHTIRFWSGKTARIVGLARNSKYMTLGEENVLAVYHPYEQSEEIAVNLHFLLRVAGRPEALLPAIRSALNRLDPTAALEVKPMREGLAFALMPSRVGAAILGAMGTLGLLLSSIGLYGVLLYSVSRRIREIGLRVALGATPGGVLRLVVGQSAALAGSGIAAGMMLAVFAVRPLAMFLSPDVRTGDLLNFAAVGIVLGAVAMAATIAPALRALRVDPVVALRHE